MPGLPRFVTVRELADRRQLNEFTIYHWIKEQPERLPRVTRLHGRVLFLEQDVLEWFESLRGDINNQASGVHYQEAVQTATAPQPRTARVGRPTKREQVDRAARAAAAGGAA